MEQLHKKTIILYSITLVTLIVAIGGALLLFQKMQLRIDAVRNVKERIASIEKYESIYKEEIKKVEIIEQILSNLQKEIVTESTIPLVLSNIELLAKESSVEAEISSAQIAATKGKPSYVSIDVRAKGTFDALVRFMKKIEGVRNESSIERFSLSEVTEEKGQLWDLSATIFVLSYK